MKHLLLATLLISSTLMTSHAAPSTAAKAKKSAVKDSTKVQFKFGGRVDLSVFADSYASKTLNRGIYYFYPLAPAINKFGNDVNADPTLNFGIGSTRLNAGVTIPNILGAKGSAFIETDFMGSSDNVFGTLRLRHAFFDLKWKNTQLLFGQTDHLMIATEATANTVSFGGGAPINPLSRVPQIRLTQNLAPTVRLMIATSLPSSGQGPAQGAGFAPDIQLKLTIGRTETSMFGITGGYRSIRPRRLTADSALTYQRVGNFNVGMFGLHTFGRGHKLRINALWGQDLSPFSMMGGYAPLLSDANDPDFGYTSVSTLAVWADFEARRMNGWQPGIFIGVEQNLGSQKEIDLAKAVIPDYGINMFWRLAPRVYYHYKSLSFGLEYMYSQASWGKEFDNHYRPTVTYHTTSDHRITFLARFSF